jgi:hypothetical protein
MNITLHHPKVIQYFNIHKNISPENILLAALPLLEICSVDDNYNTLSHIEILFNKFQENVNKSHSLLEQKVINSQYLLESTLDKNNSKLHESLALHHSHIDDNLFHKLQLSLKEQQSFFENKINLISNNNDIKLLFKEQHSHFSQLLHSTFNVIFSQHISPLAHSINEVQNNINTFTLHSQNSSKKGAISENKLQNSLVLAFPNLTIIDSHNSTAAGDKIVQHHDCGNILIENKDYSHNVPTSEVDKFFRDISCQKCHGIFISQSSGISLKDNFHVQFHDGYVTVFLHNVQYDHSPILYAVSIIKALQKIAESCSNNNITSNSVIDNDQLISIYDEWKKHNKDKHDMIITLHSIIKNLKEPSLPTLHNFIQNKFIHEVSSQWNCPICSKSCKTKAALISHQKSKHPDS